MFTSGLGFDVGPFVEAGTSIANSAAQIEAARQAAKAARDNAAAANAQAAAERLRQMTMGTSPAPTAPRPMSPLVKVLLGLAAVGAAYGGYRLFKRMNRRR